MQHRPVTPPPKAAHLDVAMLSQSIAPHAVFLMALTYSAVVVEQLLNGELAETPRAELGEELARRILDLGDAVVSEETD